jgi:two-component system NtrC family sensor kinase
MILIRVLLAPFMTLMLVCGTLVYYFATYSRDQVKEDLVRIASGHRRLVEQFLEERTSDLLLVSASYSYEDLRNEKRLADVFYSLQAGSKTFFDLGVFDEEGNHLAYIGPYGLTGKNYSEAEWFKAVQAKGLYISDVFLGYRNIPHFIIAVRSEEGGRNWYLRATIDTLYFNDLVESIRVGKTGEAYLVNQNGVLQTRRRSGGGLMEPDPDFGTYQIQEDKITDFAAAGHPDNKKYLYAAGPLKNNWVLVVRQEVTDAYAPLARAGVIAVTMIVGGGAVVVILAYILASGLANQLTIADMEKRQMKTQLIVAGKLAELGEMSAGLAHEINNPLQVMKSEHTMILDLLSDVENSDARPDPESLRLLKESADQIGLQIERCKKITQGLLGFARKTDSSMLPVKIQEFLPKVVNILEHRARIENIRIIQELDSEMPPLMSDPNQLQQVFMNLLNNAIYAFKDKPSGEIRIKACFENSCIVVSVTDNGCGITPENMEKIFLPFFTTKPAGQGTGLGLSTAYGIVRSLGGEITVTSEIDAGTSFTVRLPLDMANKGKNGRLSLGKGDTT